MKRYFIRLQFKEAAIMLPKFLLGMLVFSLLIAAVGIIGSKTLYGNSNSTMFSVAINIPENDPLVSLAYNTIIQMDDLTDYVEFIETDEETGTKLLRDGRVYGLVSIPEGFINDIMVGTNTPARIILPKNLGFESTIFRQIVEAGSRTMGYVQAGIYALSDTAYKFDASYEELINSNESINTAYIQYVLSRNKIFSTKLYSVTGELNKVSFYICNMSVILVLFVSMVMGPFYNQEGTSLLLLLKRKKITPAMITACKILIISAMFWLLFAFVAIVSGPVLKSNELEKHAFVISPKSFLNLFLMLVGIQAMVAFIYSLSANEVYSMLLLFVFGLILVFSSGLIIPSAYLPKALSAVGHYLPTSYFAKLSYGMYGVTPEIADYIIYASYTVGFYGLASFLRNHSMKNR